MKTMTGNVVILLSICYCSLALYAGENQAIPKGIAHRGLTSVKYPENTLPAFEVACKSKFWGIEYDVRETYDKKLVICHDEDVSAASDGKGRICELRLKELLRLNFGVNKNMSNVQIPQFDEVFDLCHANGKMQIIEIKDGSDTSDAICFKLGLRERIPEGKGVCDVVAEKIKKCHAEKTTRIGCFTILILLYVHDFYPEIQTHLFIGDRNVDKYIKRKKISVKKGSDAEKCLASVKSVGVKSRYLTKDIVKGFHDRGLSVDAWGISSPKEYERMKSIGVDSVTLEDATFLK